MRRTHLRRLMAALLVTGVTGWESWVATPPTDGVSEGPNPNGN